MKSEKVSDLMLFINKSNADMQTKKKLINNLAELKRQNYEYYLNNENIINTVNKKIKSLEEDIKELYELIEDIKNEYGGLSTEQNEDIKSDILYKDCEIKTLKFILNIIEKKIY